MQIRCEHVTTDGVRFYRDQFGRDVAFAGDARVIALGCPITIRVGVASARQLLISS